MSVLLYCDRHVQNTSCNFLSYMLAKMYLEFLQNADFGLNIILLTMLCYRMVTKFQK